MCRPRGNEDRTWSVRRILGPRTPYSRDGTDDYRPQHLSVVTAGWRYIRTRYHDEEAARRINEVRELFDTRPYIALPFLALSSLMFPDDLPHPDRYSTLDDVNFYDSLQSTVDHFHRHSPYDMPREHHERSLLAQYTQEATALFARLGYSDRIMQLLARVRSEHSSYVDGHGPYQPIEPVPTYAPTSPRPGDVPDDEVSPSVDIDDTST